MTKIVSNRPTITRKDIEGVLDCLIKGELKNGNVLKTFEANISSLLGLRYSLATNSLSTAYHLSFNALNIGYGDEVIIPSYFNIAPLSALSFTGATAIIVDIDDNSLIPSIDQIKEEISNKTKAIVIGHTFGFLAPIEDLIDLNIPIIEDISHVIGAIYNNKPVGTTGSITVSSLAPECLITTGNGGIALTNNSRLFSIMKEKRENNTDGENISYDYQLTDFQSAMGISQISRLQDFIKRRREISKRYYDAIKLTSHRTIYQYSESFAYQSFPVIFDAPIDKVEKYWKKYGIEINRPIQKPLHRYLKLKPMDYPNSDRLSNKLYSLPIYPALSKKEIERISKAVAKFI